MCHACRIVFSCLCATSKLCSGTQLLKIIFDSTRALTAKCDIAYCILQIRPRSQLGRRACGDEFMRICGCNYPFAPRAQRRWLDQASKLIYIDCLMCGVCVVVALVKSSTFSVDNLHHWVDYFTFHSLAIDLSIETLPRVLSHLSNENI